MAQQRPFFAARSASRSPSRFAGPVFSVGARAFANGAGGREDRVSLLDEKAMAVVGSLIDGAEVEILGWVPRGTATRYHIRATRSGLAGWLGVAHLRPTRTPQSAAPGAAAAAPVWIPPHLPGPQPEKPSPSRKGGPLGEKAIRKRKTPGKAHGQK